MSNTARQAEIFIPLIQSFVRREISGAEFETKYLRFVKDMPELLEPAVSKAVNELFGDVDAFVGDDNLRDPGDLDEDQLLDSARAALQALEAVT